MILDLLDHGPRYAALHPAFTEAFAFLAALTPARLTAGRLEIDGDRLYAMVVDTTGKGRAGAQLETHRKYIDLQYQVAGTDCIGWAPVCELRGNGYHADQDLEFYEARPQSWSQVHPGNFAIFFPADAHAPLGGKGRLLKMVVKIRLD